MKRDGQHVHRGQDHGLIRSSDRMWIETLCCSVPWHELRSLIRSSDRMWIETLLVSHSQTSQSCLIRSSDRMWIETSLSPWAVCLLLPVSSGLRTGCGLKHLQRLSSSKRTCCLIRSSDRMWIETELLGRTAASIRWSHPVFGPDVD